MWTVTLCCYTTESRDSGSGSVVRKERLERQAMHGAQAVFRWHTVQSGEFCVRNSNMFLIPYYSNKMVNLIIVIMIIVNLVLSVIFRQKTSCICSGNLFCYHLLGKNNRSFL